MPEQVKVDIRGWNRKVKKLLKEYGPTVEKIVRYGNSKVSRAVDRNLRGGSYFPGKLPVRLITGTLRRAYKINRITLYLDRKSTRLNSSHIPLSRMPSSA